MTRWTQNNLVEYQARHGIAGVQSKIDVSNPPFALPNDPRQFALGRLPIGDMNKTEAAYDAYLWQLRYVGDVLWHKFEAVKLRLADNTFYTCDFCVLAKSGELEMHEVKGFWRDDARVKIKVAASMYPFRFVALTKKNQGWKREEF